MRPSALGLCTPDRSRQPTGTHPWEAAGHGHNTGAFLIPSTVNPIKLETGLRPNSAGIPFTLLLRIEAIGFPTIGLLLYCFGGPYSNQSTMGLKTLFCLFKPPILVF